MAHLCYIEITEYKDNVPVRFKEIQRVDVSDKNAEQIYFSGKQFHPLWSNRVFYPSNYDCLKFNLPPECPLILKS